MNNRAPVLSAHTLEDREHVLRCLATNKLQTEFKTVIRSSTSKLLGPTYLSEEGSPHKRLRRLLHDRYGHEHVEYLGRVVHEPRDGAHCIYDVCPEEGREGFFLRIFSLSSVG